MAPEMERPRLQKKDTYVHKVVQQVKVGKRKKGRPKRRWRNCMKDDMEAMGLTEEDAQDRALWKAKIHTGDPI